MWKYRLNVDTNDTLRANVNVIMGIFMSHMGMSRRSESTKLGLEATRIRQHSADEIGNAKYPRRRYPAAKLKDRPGRSITISIELFGGGKYGHEREAEVSRMGY